MSAERHQNAPKGDVVPFPGRARSSPILPSDLPAEQAILGGILLWGAKAFHLVASDVSASEFYHPALAALFQAATDLDEKGRPIDQVTLPARMREADTWHTLRAVNGERYFGELMDFAVTLEALPHHARRVRAMAQNRRAMEAAQEMLARGYGPDGHSAEYAGDVARIMETVAPAPAGEGAVEVKHAMGEVLKTIERRYERKQAVTGVPSGFHRLDEYTAGFQPGDLIIVAGRPSMGKTSLVMNAAQTAAIEHRIPVLFFSLEMTKAALIERQISSEGRVDGARLRTGLLEDLDWEHITTAATRLAGMPVHIDDTGGLSISDVRIRARRWKAQQSAAMGMVVVDYLQLIHGKKGEKYQSRDREIDDVGRGLKSLAKELKCPVVALAQLGRSVESRQDKRPQLSDLRESGTIEAHADVVAFIYRDEVYNKKSDDKGVAEIIIGKQRNGAIGTVRLAFLNHFTRFENLADGRDDDDGPMFRGRGGYTRNPDGDE